jgi:carbon storage regulator
MLVLTRKENESIMIGSDIEVKVLDLKDNQVKLGIVAPRHIAVHRHEIYMAIQAENAQAAAAADVSAAHLSNIPKLFPR